MNTVDELIGACEAGEEVETEGVFIIGNGSLSITKASFDGRLPKSEMPTSIIVSRIGGSNSVSEKYIHECDPQELKLAISMMDYYKNELRRANSELNASEERCRIFRNFVFRQSRTIHDLRNLLRRASKPSLLSRLKRLLRIGE